MITSHAVLKLSPNKQRCALVYKPTVYVHSMLTVVKASQTPFNRRQNSGLSM